MTLKFAGAVAAAVLAVALTGCGSTGTGGTGGGSGGGSGGDGGASKFCTSTSCGTGEICHPSSKTCVKTCTIADGGTDGGGGCTAEATNCAPAVGGTALVCNCVSTAFCSGTAGVTGNICSDIDKVCTGKCASNADCPNNRACNTTTGQCGTTVVGDGGTTDAGTMDAGTMDAGSSCTRGSCTGTQVCNFQGGACETPKVCTTANVQPDTCGYGQYCSAAACAEVAVGTCSNFATGSNPLLWDARTSAGAAIYSITKVSFGTDTTFCGTTATVRAKIHVKAYAKTTLLLSQTNMPSLDYTRTDGNVIAVGTTQMQNYVSTGGGLAAEFDVNFCAPTGTTSLTVGLNYTTGNAACFTVN